MYIFIVYHNFGAFSYKTTEIFSILLSFYKVLIDPLGHVFKKGSSYSRFKMNRCPLKIMP